MFFIDKTYYLIREKYSVQHTLSAFCMLGNLLRIDSCLRSGFALEEFTDINRPFKCNVMNKYNKGMGILLWEQQGPSGEPTDSCISQSSILTPRARLLEESIKHNWSLRYYCCRWSPTPRSLYHVGYASHSVDQSPWPKIAKCYTQACPSHPFSLSALWSRALPFPHGAKWATPGLAGKHPHVQVLPGLWKCFQAHLNIRLSTPLLLSSLIVSGSI